MFGLKKFFEKKKKKDVQKKHQFKNCHFDFIADYIPLKQKQKQL